MDDQLEKRLSELARRCDSHGIPACTDFLDLSGQALLNRLRSSLPPVGIRLWGGADGCERKIACFFPFDNEEKIEWPVDCIRILPSGTRFSGKPEHRDVLGALMNLGFERSLLGDIVVREEDFLLFCVHRITPYITEQLTRVRNVPVRCEVTDELPEGELFRTRRLKVQVASDRLDALIAHTFNISRGDAQSLFPAGKVFLNGAACSGPDTVPAPEQIVSIRGFGRFRYLGTSSLSKKGKLNVDIDLFI